VANETIEQRLGLTKVIPLSGPDEFLDRRLLEHLDRRDYTTLTHAEHAHAYMRDRYNKGAYDELDDHDLIMFRRIIMILKAVGSLSPDVVFAEEFEKARAEEEARGQPKQDPGEAPEPTE